jgi:hypothetical protein
MYRMRDDSDSPGEAADAVKGGQDQQSSATLEQLWVLVEGKIFIRFVLFARRNGEQDV